MIRHFIYYVLMVGSGAIFIYEIFFNWNDLHSGHDLIAKPVAAIVMLLFFFVSHKDRSYLVGSIPFRIVGIITGCLGLTVVAAFMNMV